MLNEQLEELIQRIWNDTRLRSRLIDDVEETLREFGIESPEELAA